MQPTQEEMEAAIEDIAKTLSIKKSDVEYRRLDVSEDTHVEFDCYCVRPQVNRSQVIHETYSTTDDSHPKLIIRNVLDLEGLLSRYPLFFRDCEFSQSLNFSQTVIPNALGFTNCKMGDFHASKTTFKSFFKMENCDLECMSISGGNNLDEGVYAFEDHVKLIQSRVKAGCFYNVRFLKDASFSETSFGSNDGGFEGFLNLTFHGCANFNFVHFLDDFMSKKIEFKDVVFEDKVEFMSAVFHRDCDFNRAIFEQELDFSKAKFQKNASFKEAKFKRNISFSNTRFIDELYFNKAIFYSYADFHEAKFEKTVCFYGASFKKVPNFSSCYFKEPRAINFIGVDINKLDFKAIGDYIEQNYKDDKFKEEVSKIPNTKNADKLKEIEQDHRLRSAKNVKDSFRAVKDVLIEQNNILEAQEWHKRELYAKEQELRIILEIQDGIKITEDAGLKGDVKLQKIEIKKLPIIVVNMFRYIIIFLSWMMHCVRVFARQILNVSKILSRDALYFLVHLFYTFLILFDSQGKEEFKRYVEYRFLKLQRHGRKMVDFTVWANCVLLQIYRNTSDHHTNFVRILNFTIGMIALYATSSLVFAKNVENLLSGSFATFLSFAIILIVLFLFAYTQMKKFLIYTFSVFFFIFALLVVGIFTYLSFNQLGAFFLMLYLLALIIFYVVFICKVKIVVFIVRLLCYLIFLRVIVLEPQLINPFVGIFDSDKLFQSKLENKLNGLSSDAIINLAKISQGDFNLRKDYNDISFSELSAAKTFIVANRIKLYETLTATLDVGKDGGKKFNMNYSALKSAAFLSAMSNDDEEREIFGSKENQEELRRVLLDIDLEENLALTEVKEAIGQDGILNNAIKSISVIYSVILLLCIFSLQKTARKNSVMPS